jgi:hypothetical protein
MFHSGIVLHPSLNGIIILLREGTRLFQMLSLSQDWLQVTVAKIQSVSIGVVRGRVQLRHGIGHPESF